MSWAERVGLERLLAAARTSSRRYGDSVMGDLVDQFYAGDAWKWIGRSVERDVLLARLSETDLSSRSAFALLMDLYAERRFGLKGAADEVVGEKTPSHLYHLRTLLEWFPEARIVQTIRDPRGIYHSELKSRREGRWGPKARHRWLPGWLVDPLLAPVQAADTTKRWLDAARAHERCQASLPDRYQLVRFEDLVREPAQQTELVCRFLGIPYEARMVEDVPVIGSSFEGVQPVPARIEPHVADRWVSGIHPLANTWFRAALGSQMRSLRYRP